MNFTPNSLDLHTPPRPPPQRPLLTRRANLLNNINLPPPLLPRPAISQKLIMTSMAPLRHQ